MAVSYVAVLYAPMVILRFRPDLAPHLPPPSSPRLRRRRIRRLCPCHRVPPPSKCPCSPPIQAVAIPLLLTSLVYAGSFVTRLWLLESSWGSGDEVEIGCAQRLAQWIQAAVADVMVWRNYVVTSSPRISTSSYPLTSILMDLKQMVQSLILLVPIAKILESLASEELNLSVDSTLKPFIRTTPAGMQFYEIATDCRCPVRLHCNLWMCCSTLYNSKQDKTLLIGVQGSARPAEENLGTFHPLVLNAAYTGSVVDFVVLSTYSQTVQPPFKTPASVLERQVSFSFVQSLLCVMLGTSVFHFHSIHVHNTSECRTLHRMNHDHASWDDRTCSLFLELITQRKNLCHWGNNTPTATGWTNVHRAFNEATRLEYNKKLLQNKYNELKRAYFNWRDGRIHTGLGRDPHTREVTADPSWYAAGTGESSQTARERFRRPHCCEQLILILGRTPRDRGELVSAGGHQPDRTSSSASPQTPQALSDEPVQPHSVGQSSKRVTRDHSVNSPRSKKSSRTPTLDDCLDDLSNIIKDTRAHKAHQVTDAEEMAQVNQILKQDGYNKSDVVFA
ncbi:unnamed protein product [Miscanthus lutarioriparius]|uniref:Myb/SANT-like domain-containing protein n=1 Tax=Miscanthus lutarioriparius TaxID=422564 RepID=A0A811P5N0_9POAL|nr:unnamed protein product [Miscanthus lutarioriparius]